MTNRARLRRLLALMAAEINGEADAQSWTEQIQDALTATGGKPAAQRTSDDPLGVTSLLGPPKGTKKARPPARRAEVGLPAALARLSDLPVEGRLGCSFFWLWAGVGCQFGP
jgi:hypothetical protein